MITAHPSPIASFTSTPYATSITSPITFFTDLSQGNPITWQWNFGDVNSLSDTSIIPNP
jgi:PKD repeat protein